MEVSVFQASGLPEGCLLSVRAGSTRRQAPIPLAEPLRFPNLPFNAKQFKVDVLKGLGSARLDIEGAAAIESYTVEMDLLDGLGRGAVGLTVREEPSLCGKRSCELKQLDKSLRSEQTQESLEASRPGTGAARPSTAGDEPLKAMRDTREYAQAHNIPNLVQEMLQQVLRERPSNPYGTMAAYLGRLAKDRGEESVVPEPDTAASAAAKALKQADEAAERARLEAEHLRLQAERTSLLRELMVLDGALPPRT